MIGQSIITRIRRDETMEEDDEREKLKLEQELNEIPKDKRFPLVKIEEIWIPHPYCITPKHLQFSEGMYLDIEGAERKSKEAYPNDSKKWAVCDECKKTKSEHKKMKTLFIEVESNSDLNAVEGLHEYLLKIKPVCEKLGIDGFAFPNQKQVEQERDKNRD